MPWGPEDILRNREYFLARLRAMKSRDDVLSAVHGEGRDFVLLDVRTREAFAAGHVPGAWSVPVEELEAVLPLLPRNREIVTYCYGHD